MMSVLNASNLQALRPHSRGITFAVRPPSAPHRASSQSSHPSTPKSSSTLSVLSAPDHTLTFFDIESILYQKVGEKEDELINAFRTLDADDNFTVTKGEFQRVMEAFLLPLTQVQFDTLLSKIPVYSNGTIPYLNFLGRYSPVGMNVGPGISVKRSWSSTNENMALNQLEYKLKTKMSANLKNVIRSFRLFDYNQNGHLQRHELRRVLENNCFKMKDTEFEKLWSRYCVGSRNTIDYKNLLKNLGINVDINKRPIKESVQQALNWEATQQEIQKQHIWRPPSSTAEFNVEEYSIDDIEMAFSKKICANHPNLAKAFRACDASRSGLVSWDALRSVLAGFLFAVPNGMFQELMNRFGLKANETVAWEQFLEKFQDPVRVDSGRMIGSHRGENPAIGPDDGFSSNHVLRKLRRRFQEAYPALRKAFLVLDESQTGKITRKEFRRIVDCTMFRLTDEQFKELVILLDPGHTGFLSYHKFLQLLGENESVAEDILSDTITGNLKDFHKAVLSFDSKGKGVISRSAFRKIILTYCPSLSEEHFNKLCSGCCDYYSDGINYMDFLKNVGVILNPDGDTSTTHTQSTKEHLRSGGMRQPDTSDGKKEMVNRTNTHFKRNTMDGAIRNLKASLAQQKVPVGNILLAFIKKPNGKLNKTEFRKVLEDNGMTIDDDRFNIITEELGFTNEGLSYLDFASLLEDPKQVAPGVSPNQGSNYQVKKSNVHEMTAEECLSKLMDKLRQSSTDTYTIFQNTDSNHDGILTMHDLRRLLEGLLLIITEKEYLRLLDLLGLDMSSSLSYRDFLELFQSQEKKREDGRLNSSQSLKSRVADADLVCEHAHHYLVTKAKNRWNDLAKTFCEIDSKGEAIVQKKDLRNLFYRFALPIAPKEFEKLWERYDAGRKGYLTQEEFLQALGVDSCSSRDGRNTVDSIYKSLMEHTRRKEVTQAEMEAQPDKQMEYLDITETEQQTQIGIADQNNRLPYFDFFEMYKDDKEYMADQRSQTSSPENIQKLSPEKAFTKIKDIITSSPDVLYKAFSAFDKQRNGTVNHVDFLQVLESFCFKLTERQLKYLLTKLTFNENHEVHWKTFLNNCNLLNAEDPSVWCERVEKLTQTKSTTELSMKAIMTRIQEVVMGRFYTIAQEFVNTDYAKLNVISKEDFRAICNRNFMCLTDDQFESLWNILPVNAYGNLKYHEFLSKYSGESTKLRPSSSKSHGGFCKSVSPARSLSRSSSLQRRPKTAPSVLRHTKTSETFQRPRTAVPCSTPLLNCEAIEMKLRKNLHKIWQDILKACREKDIERLGEIAVSDFLAIGEKWSLDLSKEELEQLILKYDIKNNGTFSYTEFLRNCVLAPKQQENALLQRMKLQKPRIPMSAGIDRPLFVDSMLRIQPKILQCWRPMRRSFLSFDKGTGYISIQDFKQVLRQHSINLSEEELFHILGFYDKDLTLKISYNDFLRSFLQ
ncbi:EF-hand calcium-binding domain-containing protein 6 isoform X2 [Ambystoma mexicanum]|uniref:EF-hand calcium-binding domain-containing protein 6 isoform X2 n=1 Tax=Ambystoma mexicanum TaxID=8296 RepID=UPI0037E90442